MSNFNTYLPSLDEILSGSPWSCSANCPSAATRGVTFERQKRVLRKDSIQPLNKRFGQWGVRKQVLRRD
jgi:hypothetical protein